MPAELKPSLKFNRDEFTQELCHFTKNRLANDPAPLKSSQMFSLFRKLYNREAKVPKITAYVISCDVLGHDAILCQENPNG